MNYKNIEEILKLKSELICSGLKQNELSDKVYNEEHQSKIKRTSNMGLQLNLGNNIIASIPYNSKSSKNSKYYLIKKDEEYYVTDGIRQFMAQPFPSSAPEWYDTYLSNGKLITDYVQIEGKEVLICTITKSCCYFSKSEQCAFCNLNSGAKDIEKNYIDLIIEAFKIILKLDKNIKSINLTGGNTYTKDRGALGYIKILKEIRKITKSIPIAVELSPPEDLNVLQDLYDAGATAIEMNVEIWDEKIRNMLMPGKSKINRDYYVTAWKKAVEIYGIGNVGSGIIIGLENYDSSLEGIKKMIELNVLPSIIPFKPTEGSVLEKSNGCTKENIYNITKEAANLMKEKKLNPTDGPGCIGCGACTMESDFYNI